MTRDNFRGCRLDAVTAVCIDPVAGPRAASVDLQPLRIDAPAALGSLVDKNLVYVEQDEHGQVWYLLLETVREFALQLLEASPESAAIWRRHAWYYLGLAEQTRAPQPRYLRMRSSVCWSASTPIFALRWIGARRMATPKQACDWPLVSRGSGAYVATSPRDAAAWRRCWLAFRCAPIPARGRSFTPARSILSAAWHRCRATPIPA